MSVEGREIVIGVTGGVAAYKTAALVSTLVQRGAGVSVVMTNSAEHFVGRATFEALTGRAVLSEVFGVPEHPLGPHIDLAAQGELLCVAPATANFLAKAAHGLADDLLTTLLLAFGGPIVLAPAMNTQMWEKPAVQRNVAQLRHDGFHLVGPETGWLSCRQQGAGRMSGPDELLAAIEQVLASAPPRGHNRGSAR
jgi:phosphopantothenoylcysteine decarboxylase/phosphopantothenate--cysteine ligase